MAIYDFSTKSGDGLEVQSYVRTEPVPVKKKASVFSGLASRLFFLVLLTADLLWMSYTLVSSIVFLFVILCSGGKAVKVKKWQARKWISLRRSLVCAVALVVALFSPSFGVMVACTYFLMYDKAGIEEVVPSALQAEFKEMIPKSASE